MNTINIMHIGEESGKTENKNAKPVRVRFLKKIISIAIRRFVLMLPPFMWRIMERAAEFKKRTRNIRTATADDLPRRITFRLRGAESRE